MHTRLLNEFQTLSAAFRSGSIVLPSFVLRTESLVEQMQEYLSGSDFERAMNSVYLIEEINAVVLDARRLPTQAELEALENEISLLNDLIAG